MVTVAVGVTVGVMVAVRVALTVAVGVTVKVAVRVAVRVAVTVAVRVAVTVAVAVLVAVRVAVAVTVAVTVGVRYALAGLGLEGAMKTGGGAGVPPAATTLRNDMSDPMVRCRWPPPLTLVTVISALMRTTSARVVAVEGGHVPLAAQ